MEPDTAQHAINIIATLYKIEKYIRDKKLDKGQTLAYRQQHSEPIVHAFFIWVYEQRQRPELLPSNPLTKALAYVSERQSQLKVFLSNPDVPIDTLIPIIWKGRCGSFPWDAKIIYSVGVNWAPSSLAYCKA
jgi:hypothetical protein